jgi:tetratricopeptide (TPR) repeat protein
MLGAIAQADHRFADAASHLERAATSSQELGFLGQAAYHLTRLGRVQQQAGDRDLAAVTLYRAIEAARTDGDLRMAATANVNLARVLRATDHTEEAVALLTRTDEWYRQSGGGDGALLTRVLLASMTCPDPTTAATERLEQLREEAVQAHSPEVEVLALDALARIAAQRDSFDRAGQLLELADVRSCEHSTAVDDMDRIDAMLARALLAAH